MAERGSTVRVTGLPSDINQERLEDKLCIHFQRGRSGGGEVVSVTTVHTSPELALITFEDSRVAQRVIQQKQHILEVDGKRHNLIVSQHPGNLQQDKVIINLSATIDCSQLSEAKKTLKTLNKSHPEVHINYSFTQELCTLSGSYSTVQAALAQLLGHPQPSKNTELNPQPSTENKPNHLTPLPCAQVSHDQSRKDKIVEKHSLQRDVTPGGYDWDNTCQVVGATANPSATEEDFSLMMDADMFQYLQIHCGDKYHQILRQHGVAVVDFTHQGLTTLLLQMASGDGVQDQECLRKAREKISWLYEDNQAYICRDKIEKTILPNREGLKRAFVKLSGRFPKLLVTEDDKNVYVIGSRDDVAEAKRFLLLHDHSKEDKSEITSPRRFMGSWPVDEVKTPHVSTSSYLENGLDQVRAGEEKDGKLEAGGRYTLAAHFKDSPLAAIGGKTSNFNVRGHSNKQTRHGPMLGHDVLTGAKGNANASGANANAKATGINVVLKNTLVTDLQDTKPNASTVSPIQNDSLASLTPSTAASGSSLRRTSSFSGSSQKKDRETSPRSLDDSDKGKKIGRSSSFSGGTNSSEITVDNIMWRHITEAYKPRIEELTSGVQIREKRLESGRDVTIHLTGTILAKVSACYEGLKKLIESVKVDFSVSKLPLFDLGINDSTDEALQACCAEIRSRYKKISMQIHRESLFLFGPKMLCTQIYNSLCEVFDGRKKDLREAELANSQVSQRRDAVIKEKVQKPVSSDIDAFQFPVSVNGNINGSATSRIDKNAKIKGEKATTVTKGCNVCRKEGVQLKTTDCGVTGCSECLDSVHLNCRVCKKKEPNKLGGVQGKMSYSKLPMSIPGYIKDPVVKITYNIPDGIQGEDDPFPGNPFKGGVFEAFLPDCELTRRLLPRLQEAFRRGHTFTVTKDRVNWDIPHKTSLQGGRSGSGYPDSSYLNRLSFILDSLMIP